MNQSERRRAIETKRLSTRVATTIPSLALIFGVTENTIKSDLLALEVYGAAYCANPEGKPQKWYATQASNDTDMSLELAFALKNVQQIIKTTLPAELYNTVAEYFDAANDTFQRKKKANHQSNVVKFERATGQIDLLKYCLNKHTNKNAFEAIKSAIYSDNDLALIVDNCEYELSGVSLVQLDETLYVKGQKSGHNGKTLQFNTEVITSARIPTHNASWNFPRRATR